MINRSFVRNTRIQFKRGEISPDLLTELYLKYNKIENIHVFLQRAKLLFPKLNCGIASLYLQHKLGGGKIVNGKYGHNNHTFLLVNNTIVDITADQFGGPEVYIGPPIKPWVLK